jgi:hypothetical protein
MAPSRGDQSSTMNRPTKGEQSPTTNWPTKGEQSPTTNWPTKGEQSPTTNWPTKGDQLFLALFSTTEFGFRCQTKVWTPAKLMFESCQTK